MIDVHLARQGFVANPFEFTNAERETRLDEYFVPPPYFPSVLGDTRQPQSKIVLAPRGGGKTAQRLMIERHSAQSGNYLCITLDDFDLLRGPASLDYHLTQVSRRILLGILTHLSRVPADGKALSQDDKEVLKYQVDHFLSKLSAQELTVGIDSIKNFGDRVSDVWDKYGGPLSTLTSVILKRVGLDGIVVPDHLRRPSSVEGAPRFHFRRQLDIVRRLGFDSTYVLVDKVDEGEATMGDAAKTFEFIKPLLTDLPTLETPGVAFKFFLWDQIDAFFRHGGARPDRVQIHRLRWTVPELKQMLTQRLRAYSNGQVSSMNRFLPNRAWLDLDSLVTYIAAGSPRDMIRACARIVDEETRMPKPDDSISSDNWSGRTVWSGVARFADERADELAGDHLKELRRVGQLNFTIAELQPVFHVSTQAARNKVQNWMRAGLVSRVGEMTNQRNKPVHLFGLTDPRVALAIAMATHEIRHILSQFIVQCPYCAHLCITTRLEIECSSCHRQFPIEKSVALLKLCRRNYESLNW